MGMRLYRFAFVPVPHSHCSIRGKYLMSVIYLLVYESVYLLEILNVACTNPFAGTALADILL